MTIAEYKNIWSWKTETDGSVTITSYKGNEKEVIVPSMIGKKTVKCIGERAFSVECIRSDLLEFVPSRKKIEKVVISYGIEIIKPSAFAGCKSLKNIVLPDSITEIGDFAFDNTAITSIVCPPNIECLGAIFANCKELKEVVLPKKFRKLDRTFIGSGIEKCDIPEGVEEIICAFEDCEKLKEVSLPSTLKWINLGTFENCNSIEKMTVAKNKACRLENGFLYESFGYIENKKENIIIAKLKTIDELPSETTLLSKACITDRDIKEYVIPIGITEICIGAFENCIHLEKVTIPETVKIIGSGAFEGCTSLKEVIIPENVELIKSGAFVGCTALKSVVLPRKAPEIEFCCFAGCESLERIVFPDDITIIPTQMFWGCKGLSQIVLPDTIKTIEYRAFINCTGIKQINLPNGLETIETEAFMTMYNLEKVIIPRSVKKIEKDAFAYCCNLTICCEDTEIKKGWSTIFNRHVLKPVQWGYKNI